MLKQEVQKKTMLYGLVAVLSAVLLISTIYAISSPIAITSNVTSLKTFSSSEQIKNYIVANTEAGSSSSPYVGGPLDHQVIQNIAPSSPNPGGDGEVISPIAQPDYSTTNVQVAGVDEADSVKTDGTYLYVNSQNSIYILNADPNNAKVLAKINMDNTSYIAGMFLSQNSSKLVVVGSQYGQIYPVDVPKTSGSEIGLSIYQHIIEDVRTFVNVYNITDKASPMLARNFTISGSYFNSRLVGNNLYAVVSQQATVADGSVVLPEVYNQTETYQIQPNNIYYIDQSGSYFTYTTFVGLDVSNDTLDASTVTMLMGETSNMYVSQSNMYVTFPSPTQDEQGTVIYRISINGTSLSFESKGKVPGYILNQYSMDEFNGYFRIATCVTTGSWINQEQQNGMYVLDSNLNIVGKIENLGVTERIYAARFVGDKCYLVTYRQVDPFYTIDLSNPVDPKVVGQLKIPGYSSYLHPYGDTHVIGVGKENNSVKLSLFDVSDMSKPVEVASMKIGDWAYSPALNDPKAFVFNPESGLLILPISINNYPEIVPMGTDSVSLFDSWQGVYVFNVTFKGGFIYQGSVTQIDANATSSPDYYSILSNQTINRAAFINQTLYTISNTQVQLNNLGNFTYITKVNLP
jgi:inhibitor of cysteine peptidase